MASLALRLSSNALRPTMAQILVPCRTLADKALPDPLELATGLEKREMLARLAGNLDPWQRAGVKRGPATKDNPCLVPSAYDKRVVGCVCEEDSTYIQWMWVHKGVPKRCECGYWFKLVEIKPI